MGERFRLYFVGCCVLCLVQRKFPCGLFLVVIAAQADCEISLLQHCSTMMTELKQRVAALLVLLTCCCVSVQCAYSLSSITSTAYGYQGQLTLVRYVSCFSTCSHTLQAQGHMETISHLWRWMCTFKLIVLFV